ncbi:hypothetical protein HHI36_017739 [Cryptolaemus montrouzieri]|uniref:Globin domain-containing protein n=1 Tax=Cryptolaemus montrouzieri TaxID=559131 RepID=A0ABD2NNT0_9CUCU
MGIIWSYLGYTNEDEIDPITGLTGKDKRLIQASNSGIRKNAAKNGADILYVFFEKYPEYQKYFPFRDVPLNELKTNKRFIVHCNSVMYALMSWSDNLENPEILIELFLKLGQNHKRHNLPDQSFRDLRDTVLACLKPLLSKETHDAHTKLWKIATETVLTQI